MRRKKKSTRQAGITQDQLLSLLEKSERPDFKKRQLSKLTREGLLPQPKRTSQAGSNKPA